MLTGKLELVRGEEKLALVKRGLRNIPQHRVAVLGAIGNEFVWNQEPQNPRAIELLYHASAGTDPGVAQTALYHGSTVVSHRTPNLVRMLMERFPSLDPQMQQRIAWGMKTYGDKEETRKILLGLLDQHEKLNELTTCAALETYQSVFGMQPPQVERFARLGQWVIAFHRSDISASHPRGAKLLREMLDHISLQNQQLQLIDFVTRADKGHETAVALVQGLHSREVLTTFLASYTRVRIDFNTLLTSRTLQEKRLREFARHLPDGLPPGAVPAYTHPPADAKYAFDAKDFIAPDYTAFFADDVTAARELDQVYADRLTIDLTDRELLDLFRRGVRRSAHTPNVMFGWISGALGWPGDPRLTEILYQGTDPRGPFDVRSAAIYYGFGLGTSKTNNILRALFQAYLAPPFDRSTNANFRDRILWGVRDDEDDKYELAKLFLDALQDHAKLSDEAVIQAAKAYRELTGEQPPNQSAFASRGIFVAFFRVADAKTIEESRARVAQMLGKSPLLIDTRVKELKGEIIVIAAVRGLDGQTWLINELKKQPNTRIYAAELLTRELIQNGPEVLKELEKLLPSTP